jgi:hypothetical protein
MVCNQTISDILDFFHAYVGFCVDPSSLLSPLSKWVLLTKFCKVTFISIATNSALQKLHNGQTCL